MGKLKTNFLYNIGYQILIIIIPLITAPYLSRVLGVDGIGMYSYLYSIAYYFGLFSMLGISNHGNRTIALSKKDINVMSSNFWNLYFVQFICSIVSILFYLITSLLVMKNDTTLSLINLLFIFSYMFDITWFYFGIEQFKTTVIRNTFFKILTVILIFLFVKNYNDLWKYTLIMGGGSLFSQLYLWIPLKKYVIRSKISFRKIRKHLKPILLLFIPVLSYSIYKVMDKIMLGNLTGFYQVGIYENSEKIIGIPTSIITALGTVMMPRISSLLSENKNDMINKYYSISFKYFTILTCCMIFGLISISKTLIPLYYGLNFIDCSKTISILSISLIFLSWANIIRTQYLIPNRKDKIYIISTFIGAAVNLLANLCLIPKYGSNGAAIGTVLAEFSVFLVQFLFTKNELKCINKISCILYLLPIGFLMCFLTESIYNIFGTSIKSLILQFFVSGSIYMFFVSLILFFENDSFFIDNMVNLLKKVKGRLWKK